MKSCKSKEIHCTKEGEKEVILEIKNIILVVIYFGRLKVILVKVLDAEND